MQQMQVDMAGQVTQGVMNWLMSPPSGPSAAEIEAQRQREEAARQEAIRQEQLRLERERLVRVKQAGDLKNEWDNRDAQLTESLGGVFDVVRHRNTPTFGQRDNARLDPEPAPVVISPAPIGVNDAATVNLGGAGLSASPALLSPPISLMPTYQNLPLPLPVPSSGSSDELKAWLKDKSIEAAREGASDYVHEFEKKHWFAGYYIARVWDGANTTYDYVSDLREQYHEMADKFQAVHADARQTIFGDISLAAANLGSQHTDDAGLSDRVDEHFKHEARSFQDAALDLAEKRIKRELKARWDRDALIAGYDPSDTAEKPWEQPRVVPLETTKAQLGYSPWSQQQYHIYLGEAGYP